MSSVYPIVPGGSRPLYLLIPVFVILVSVLALLFKTAYGSQRASVELTGDRLAFHGDLYGKAIPLDSLRIRDARIVSFDSEPSLAPRSRRLGTGLPGYLSGWFRLGNGEKALVFITTRHRVVYLPTAKGYSVLLSLQQPEAFLDNLRTIAPVK
jgi:Bacterial PH domain